MPSNWASGFIEWTEGNTAFLSVVFSWQLQEAYQRAVWWRQLGYEVKAGGPAVALNSSIISDVADIECILSALARHNPDATFTSRGCIRKCSFCAVPKIEGELVELDDWPIRPIVCDNNLLACSRKHFDSVIDKLKGVSDVDFNQGLDARLLTKYHAGRLAELKLKYVRLAWDHIKTENQFLESFQTLMNTGIPPSKIRVYVLFGFHDTPEDTLYRMKTIRKLKALPNPQRYQPLDAKNKNKYIDPNWTKRELKRYSRYWSRLKYWSHIPFEEWLG